MSRVTRKKQLPRLRSREAAARFFETHDSADYEPHAGSIEIDPVLERRILRQQEKRQVTLRLHQWMIDAAKAIGLRTGVPYQVLLKLWIAQGIHERSHLLRLPSRRRRRLKAS